MFLFFTHPILIAAAIIPAVALMIYVYKADRLEKESHALLLSLVLYGALATVIAVLAERVGSLLLSLFTQRGGPVYRVLMYFGVVGFSEEGAKYVLLKRRTWMHPEFDCQFDGVVYAVFVSLGFALWENIGYVFSYGLGTALVRALTAVPGHACFGVLMGVWYAQAKRYAVACVAERARWHLRMAVILPALAHGLYDYIATDSDGLSWAFVIFVVILFALSWYLVKRAADEDTRIG